VSRHPSSAGTSGAASQSVPDTEALPPGLVN
jgi:hypothetical protein